MSRRGRQARHGRRGAVGRSAGGRALGKSAGGRALGVALVAIVALAGLAVLLVSGAGVAGATTLAATEGPLPSGFTLESADDENAYIVISGISCASDSWCVAVGSGEDSSYAGVPIIYTQSSGSWTAAVAPVPSDGSDGDGELVSVSCSSEQQCTAVGIDGAGNAFADTIAGDAGWQASSLTLPGNALSEGSEPELKSVDCPADGQCVAVGGYKVTGDYYEGLAESLSSGSWTPSEVELPPATVANPPLTESPEDYNWLTAVSCQSLDDCVVVGDYTGSSGDYSSGFGWTSTLSDGGWSTSSELPVPPGAYTYDGNFDATLEMQGLACPTDGVCLAVGEVQISASDDEAAATYTLSPSGSPTTTSTSSSSTSTSTSTSPGSTTSTTSATSSSGGWTASLATLPDDANASDDSDLDGVTCTGSPAASCVAVGDYLLAPYLYDQVQYSTLQPLTTTITESGGTWGSASPGTTPVPANANYIGNTEDRPNPGNPTDPDALLTSVTCLTSAECVEGGYYDDLDVSEVEYGCPSGCTNSMIVGETADQPQDPQASPGDGSVTVSWEAPDTDGGEAIAGYDVYEGTTSGGEGTTPVNGTLISSDTFSYQVSDLTNGDAYYFTVEAVNAVGSSPPSSEVSATPGESTTTSTSASTTTSTTATTTSTTSTSTTPSSTSTTSTTTTSTTTTSTTTTSTLASGGGPPQSIKGVVAPPLAPTAISATAGDGNVVVQWSAPLGGPSITGYDVYGGTSPGGESSMPVNGAPLSPATTTYTVSGLENGTRYYFVVQALAAGASSPHSNEVSATPTSLGALLEPGTVFVSDFSGRVIEIAPDGPEASVGSGLDLPAGLAIDAKGDLYVADEKNDRVVRLAFVAAPAGATGATGAAGGSDAAGAPTQSVAAPDLCNATICVLDPVGVAVDAAGDLFVADTGNDDVLEYPVAGGGPRRVDGHGLTGTGRSLSAPAAVAANASGQLYVADTGDGTVVRVNLADDLVTTVVSGLDEPDGIAVDTEGNVWIADSGSGELLELTPGGTLRTAARGLDAPDAVAVDSDDDVYVAEDDGVFELNPVSGAKRAIGTGLDQPVGLAVYPPAVPAAASPPLHAAVSARAASDHAASTHGASARAASPHATSPHAAAPDRRRLRRRSES